MRYPWSILILALPLMMVVSACGGDKAGGTARCTDDCFLPPGPQCDGDELVISSPGGTCTGGACVYEEERQACAHGCSEGACLPDPGPCSGQSCATPPAPFCDGDVAVSYEGPGTCNPQNGQCSYERVRRTCDADEICFDGECRTRDCDFVTCDDPPGATCIDGDAVTYGQRGTCNEVSLECEYPEFRDPCSERGLECGSGICSADPLCEGVVCSSPRAPFCDGQTAVRDALTGTCSAGVCSYDETTENCATDDRVCSLGQCVNLCDGVACTTPPPDVCDGSVAISFPAVGECDDGSCSYEETRFDCANEEGLVCDGGRCIPDPRCAARVCETPPADACVGDTLVYYEAAGVCVEGACEYLSFEEDCAARDLACEEGACVDPCEGRFCVDPPADFCVENTAFFFGAGVCSVGTCNYQEFEENCSLTGRNCVDGFCRGDCDPASCTDPPPFDCDGDLAIIYDQPPACVDSTCAYDSRIVDCAAEGAACVEGVCLELCPEGPCTDPPPSECDGDVVVSYADWGDCEDGTTCVFDTFLTDCAETGEICLLGECRNACFTTVCAPPPPAFCEEDILVIPAMPSTCVDGECFYEEITVNCRESNRVCDSGACVNPCIDVVCNDVPDAFCDGATVVNFNSPGVCNFGDCTYNETRTTCGSAFVCEDGACVSACIGVTCDDPPDNTCDGDFILSYDGTGGCIAGECVYSEARTDCSPGGLTCENAQCVDPCLVVTCDDPPESHCDNDSSVAYASTGTCFGGNCTYAEVRVDCSRSGGWCEDAVCVDACTGLDCGTVSGSVCEGMVAVTFNPGPAICMFGECAYDSDEEDCLITERVCDDGECIDVADVCAVLDCPARGTFCDGDTLVTDSGDGSCNPLTPFCDYSGVESRTECDAPLGCYDGACVRAPQPGDLVISEIFYDADGSDYGEEWFEVRNVSGDALEFGGLRFMSARNAMSFEVEASMSVAPGAYVVFASSATAVAGAEDYIYDFERFNLDNTSDGVRISRNDVEIDSVAFDELALWPAAFGASLQLTSAVTSPAGNNAPGAWCLGVDVYKAGALGTPGTANRTCP